jgi:N-acetylglucosamine-6-phosphate deacetylase
MLTAYTADKIFTGTEWLSNHAVIVNDEIISEIVSLDSLQKNIPVLHSHILAPAFIDVQIYGASKKLFAVYPTTESLAKLYEHCVAGGTHYFLPTVATNTYEVFYKCIDAIKEYWDKKGKGVVGLHIEGPWINKIKRGAHIESLIHSPTISEVKELLEYGKGVIKMITLAPEVCSQEIIDLVNSYNIIISAGHSNATFNVAAKAFDNGIKVATHLFNAMSPLGHREPGLPGAILQHSSVMSSIIPDGFHVDFEMINIAKKIMNERLFIITDAVTETNEGLSPHKLEGDKYVSNGILSGSALTMIKAVKNCIEKINIDLGEALRMVSLYPAKVLGLDHKLGKIKEGYKSKLVLLDKDINVISS